MPRSVIRRIKRKKKKKKFHIPAMYCHLVSMKCFSSTSATVPSFFFCSSTTASSALPPYCDQDVSGRKRSILKAKKTYKDGLEKELADEPSDGLTVVL